MANDPDVPLPLEPVGEEPRRAVGRAIVDDEDVGREAEDLVEDLLDMPNLVEDRQGREEFGCRGTAPPGSVRSFRSAISMAMARSTGVPANGRSSPPDTGSGLPSAATTSMAS
jgi:hypothetical protein